MNSPTKKVRINLTANVALAYSEIMEVPAGATVDEINGLVRERQKVVPAADYKMVLDDFRPGFYDHEPVLPVGATDPAAMRGFKYQRKADGAVVDVQDRSETAVAFLDEYGDHKLSSTEDFDRDYQPATYPRYRNRITGEIVEVLGRAAGVVAFFPQGGGFNSAAYEEAFDRAYEPAPAPAPFVRGTVGAEWFDERHLAIACVSNGDRWNGWGMPYFERAQVDQLITLMPDLRWENETKEKVIGHDPEEDIWAPELITLANGEQLQAWGIGAGFWTWDQVKPDGGAPADQTADDDSIGSAPR